MNRKISIPRVFSLELIMLALLTGVYFALRPFILLPLIVPYDRSISALLVLFLGIYALLDFFESDETRWPILQTLRTTLILLVIFIIVIIPAGLAMGMRATTAPYRFVHDGLIQSEAAARFLLRGENPYGSDYHETPLADWPYDEGGVTVHPALSHYPYLPLTFLLPLPIQWFIDELFGWFDQRIVLLLFFAGTLWLAWGLSENPVNQRLLLIISGLNPLLVIFVIEGRNDIMTLFWLLATVRLLQVRRSSWSSAALGIACATKQFAWLFVPFYFAWLASGSGWRQIYLQLRKPLAIFVIVLGSLIIPWLLWDAPAFLEDTLVYQAGGSAHFAIGGFGVGSLFLSVGIIQPDSDFPFAILQVTLGLPLLVILIARMRMNRRLQYMLAGYGLWLLAVLFLARSFSDNYLGFIVSVLSASAFADGGTDRAEYDYPRSDNSPMVY